MGQAKLFCKSCGGKVTYWGFGKTWIFECRGACQITVEATLKSKHSDITKWIGGLYEPSEGS